jgi:hypothetical protein
MQRLERLLAHVADGDRRPADELREGLAGVVRTLDPQRPHADQATMYASFRPAYTLKCPLSRNDTGGVKGIQNPSRRPSEMSSEQRKVVLTLRRTLREKDVETTCRYVERCRRRTGAFRSLVLGRDRPPKNEHQGGQFSSDEHMSTADLRLSRRAARRTPSITDCRTYLVRSASAELESRARWRSPRISQT